MLREHFKCSLPLPTGHIVGKMHMSSKCTQHVITGFQAPLPPVSPSLTEIICRVLANDSHGIIGGHLSVDSLQLGYQIGIEVRVSSEVGDEILGSFQESLEDNV